MGIVDDLLNEHDAISYGQINRRKHYRTIAKYVLPQSEEFDMVVEAGGLSGAMSAVVHTNVAAERSKDIYDMTSIWAVERLTAGLLSLKTPETDTWHSLGVDDMLGEELDSTSEEQLERVRDYLFKVRNNPATGFWPAYRAALRSCCAFGDGWYMTTEDVGLRTPWRYEFVPLNEVNAAVDYTGRPNRMFRPRRMSAIQMATKWGSKVGSKIMERANDPKKRHDMITVMQVVMPRDEMKRGALGVLSADFASYYVIPEDKILIGEGGYFDFPYHRLSWGMPNLSAYSSGPVDYALGEIKSLQEMKRNQLIASAQAVRPAMATHGTRFGRLNFNPGVNNPNLINAEGRPLFAPLNGGARPDLAQAVIEATRDGVRESLYLNLWQILIEQPEKTATEAMIRAQEKGELLGPVGISLNFGLSTMIDRELSIMTRKGAFDDRGPFPLDVDMTDREVAPMFTSPLDRLRRLGEVVGMQRLAAFAGQLAELMQDPSVAQRLDADEMLERAQDILGAPVGALKDREEHKQGVEQGAQMAQMMQMLEGMKGGGDAMQSLGRGATELAAAQQNMQAAGQGGAQGAIPAPGGAPGGAPGEPSGLGF